MLAPILLTVAVLTQAVPPTAPALSREDMAKFLTTAKVVGHHDIDKGVTHPVRLTLSDGTMTHDAAFTLVDEHKEVMQLDSGRTELNFIDSYKYTLAAYGIAEILAVDDMMPVTVPFQWDQHKGALSWWLDVKMDEGERMKKKLEAPDLNEWGAQVYRMRVFAALIGDTDLERRQHPHRSGLEAVDDRLHAGLPDVEGAPVPEGPDALRQAAPGPPPNPHRPEDHRPHRRLPDEG